MKLEILYTSIVVIAEHLDPSILHPSYLVAEGIIPKDWELAEPSISTPVRSNARFTNGIAFSVDPNRFQVVENDPIEDYSKSLLPQLARTYIDKLPKVRYMKLGINVKAFIEHSSAGGLLVAKFLTEGSWDREESKPTEMAIRLGYPLKGSLFRLGIESGRATRTVNESESRLGIILDANYHTDLPDGSPMETLEESIKEYPDRISHAVETFRATFELGG